jgi:hypothetical protein
MLYGAYFDRVLHDIVGNSQNPRADDSLCRSVAFMLRNMCGFLEKCGPRIKPEFLEFLVHFVDHSDLMGTRFWVEVIYV